MNDNAAHHEIGRRSVKQLNALFRQSNFLAEGLHPRIAAKQGQFWPRQSPANPKGPPYSGTVQSFEGSILVAQAGKKSTHD